MNKNWQIGITLGLLCGLCVLMLAQQPTKPVDTGGSSLTTTQGGSAPASVLLGGCTYLTSGVSLSNSQSTQLQCDSNGNLLVNLNVPSILPVIGSPTTSSSDAFTITNFTTAAAANAKSSGGNFYGMVLFNNGSIPCTLELFNNSSTPTAGTSVIDNYTVQAGLPLVIQPGLIALKNYSSGIAFAGATAPGGSTTTGCTSTFTGTLYYK